MIAMVTQLVKKSSDNSIEVDGRDADGKIIGCVGSDADNMAYLVPYLTCSFPRNTGSSWHYYLLTFRHSEDHRSRPSKHHLKHLPEICTVFNYD